jgi:uncharacterized membrane protein
MSEKEYGTYSAPWTKTFDLVFLIGWLAGLAVLTGITILKRDTINIDSNFFAFGVVLAGICCWGWF